MRQARSMCVAAPLLGQVGAGTAKADEIAELVMDRPAADRPPSLLARNGGADRELLEGRAGGEVELQRAFALLPGIGEVEQLDQRLADQLVRRGADGLRNGSRDVGQQRTAIGLPEP